MHMVANTANPDDLASGIIDQLSNIAVNAFQMFIGYLGAGCLDVEYHMKINFAK